MGRFIEQDPVGEAGGANLYAYVGSSPAMWVDPTGLARRDLGGGSGISGDRKNIYRDRFNRGGSDELPSWNNRRARGFLDHIAGGYRANDAGVEPEDSSEDAQGEGKKGEGVYAELRIAPPSLANDIVVTAKVDRNLLGTTTSWGAGYLFDVAAKMELEYDYTRGCCEARAHEIGKMLRAAGLDVSKVWASPVSDNQRMSPRSDPEPSEEEWWKFHVAAAIKVQDGDSEAKYVVIDASLSDGPASIDEWGAAVRNFARSEIKEWDVSGGSYGGNGYLPGMTLSDSRKDALAADCMERARKRGGGQDDE